jgi:hypothetical protein
MGEINKTVGSIQHTMLKMLTMPEAPTMLHAMGCSF